MKSTPIFFRYLAYSLEILIFYIVQTTPMLVPEIFGSKPLLLLAVAFSIAAKENQIPALIFGAVCGAMTDIASSGSIGFFAITLTLICYFESNIFKNYFVSSVVSVFVFALIIIPVIICLYFLIFTVTTGIADWQILFVNHYISRIIYSLVMIVPFYFLNSFFISSR